MYFIVIFLSSAAIFALVFFVVKVLMIFMLFLCMCLGVFGFFDVDFGFVFIVCFFGLGVFVGLVFVSRFFVERVDSFSVISTIFILFL